MVDEIKEAFSEYNKRMAELAVSLLAVSNHLDNIAKYLGEVSKECNNVSININKYISKQG